MDMIINVTEKIIMLVGFGAIVLLAFGMMCNIAASLTVKNRRRKEQAIYSQRSGQAAVTPLSYQHNLKLVA